MSTIHWDRREIGVKVVYWGPPDAGKWTNLAWIYEKTSSGREALPKANHAGFPLSLGEIRGFKTVMSIYRVPASGSHTKYILDDIDGLSTDAIMFVADSRPNAVDANRASLDDLVRELAARGFDLGKLSVVMQYNKRDVPDAIRVEHLRASLNPWGFVEHEAIANRGVGVFDSLKSLSKLVLAAMKNAG